MGGLRLKSLFSHLGVYVQVPQGAVCVLVRMCVMEKEPCLSGTQYVPWEPQWGSSPWKWIW